MKTYPEHDLFGSTSDAGSIELGTVGWGDDSHFELGTDDNGGVTLVKVKLLRGLPEQGQELLCRLSAPLWFVPDVGSQVLVAVPAGFSQVPGAPVIIAAPGANPSSQFGGGKAADAILDFGPDRRVIIKAGKGVILSDYENRYVGVGPELGVKVGAPDASGCLLKGGTWTFYAVQDDEAKAVLKLSPDAVLLNHKAADGKVAALKLKGGNCTIPCAEFSAVCSNALIGAKASPATPVQFGPGPGAPSTNIFVQP